jgi:Ca2+-binding EF-hand superfamily protein
VAGALVVFRNFSDLFRKVLTAEVKDFTSTAEKTPDEKITFELFDQFCANRFIYAKLQMPPKDARDKLFRKFDVDGGGSISLIEAEAALQSVYGNFNLDNAIVQAAFYAADTSMDGSIGKIEFRQLLVYINFFQPLWDQFEMVGKGMEGNLTPVEFPSGMLTRGGQRGHPAPWHPVEDPSDPLQIGTAP